VFVFIFDILTFYSNVYGIRIVSLSFLNVSRFILPKCFQFEGFSLRKFFFVISLNIGSTPSSQDFLSGTLKRWPCGLLSL
jgi:hypothetical protein